MKHNYSETLVNLKKIKYLTSGKLYNNYIGIQSETYDLLQEEKTVVVEIKLKRGESVEKALRRLKKKMDKEGTMKEIRGHRYFEKPSEKRRRKAARARMGPRISPRISY